MFQTIVISDLCHIRTFSLHFRSILASQNKQIALDTLGPDSIRDCVKPSEPDKTHVFSSLPPLESSQHKVDAVSDEGPPSDGNASITRGRPNVLESKGTITDLSRLHVPEIEIVSLLQEEIPKYHLRADYLTEFGGYANEDFVIQTPVLDPEEIIKLRLDLTPELARATLDYFLSCGDRLSQMTKTYHDVDAVTRLLQEKEKDLELAAKIGQELLERNRILEERTSGLEYQVQSATELITQLRHELQIKTDLLHVYSSDAAEESSPLELRNIGVELLQKKVKTLEIENKKLQEEAAELAKEAFECEEKEERLVSDAVKHLTEANVQISQLSEDYSVKSNESNKQKEEIYYLAVQVNDLQSKVKSYSVENDELSSQLRVYKETQDDLTTELADFKEKYREVVELLEDTRDELRKTRKRSYPGHGQHNVSGMFHSSPADGATPDSSRRCQTSDHSLQYEIQDSVRSSRKSKSSGGRGISDAEMCSSKLKRAFQTYKIATANKMPRSCGRDTVSPRPSREYQPGQGSSLDNSLVNKSLEDLYPSLGIRYLPNDYSVYSYTISRDDSRSSVDFFDLTDEVVDYSNYADKSDAGSMSENCFAFETRTNDTLTMTSSKLRVPSTDLLYSNTEDELSAADELNEIGAVGVGFIERSGDSNVPWKNTYGFSSNFKEELLAQATPFTEAQNAETEFETSSEFCNLSINAKGLTQEKYVGHPGIGEIPRGEVMGLVHPNVNTLGSLPGLGDYLGRRGGPSFCDSKADLSELQMGGPSDELSISGRRGHPGMTEIGSLKQPVASRGDQQEKEFIPPSWLPDGDTNDSGVVRVKTVGVLEPPSVNSGNARTLALALPLGSVPNQRDDAFSYGKKDMTQLGGGAEATNIMDLDASREMSDLEFTLANLNPSEVERRRKIFKQQTQLSYELGSDGYGSPGSLMGKPGFNFLPYGVRTPDSIMSTGSRDWLGSAGGYSGYGAGWKLPDKLRIVKPLEGSLTLHNWSRLAIPSLGGIFEERSGVAIKGANYPTNSKQQDSQRPFSDLDEMDLFDLDSEFCDEAKVSLNLNESTQRAMAKNSRRLYRPIENTVLTQSYKGSQFSSGFPSMSNSAALSRCSSVTSLNASDAIEFNRMRKSQATTNFSADLGLASLLNERNIYGGSTLSMDKSWSANHSDVASICSLTPSVISSPKGDKAFSPTGTPLNSPMQTPPRTPPNEPTSSASGGVAPGFVQSFFSSLRSALYGEQQKEVQAQIMRSKRKKKKTFAKRLGILEKVEEAGIERFLSASPAPSSLEGDVNERFWSSLSKAQSSKYKPDLLSDELEVIEPGTLTVSRGKPAKTISKKEQDPLVGQLQPPSATNLIRHGDLGRFAYNFGSEDASAHKPHSGSSVGGRGPGRVISPSDKRPLAPGVGYGVPGQPGTGALRHDLGHVPVTAATFNQAPKSRASEEPESAGFIGSIAQMFFGRKGGLF